MFPLLQLGPIALQIPGLILILSLWIALNIIEKEAKRTGQPDAAVYGLVAAALAGGIVGARLWYVVLYWDAYTSDWLGIVSLNTSTLDWSAGLIIGIGAGVLYGRWKKLLLRPTLDTLAVGLAFMSIGAGLSYLASGNAFGSVTNLPWGIYLWDASRHPTQIYEMLFATGIFAILWRIRKDTPYAGFIFLAWAVLTAVMHLFLAAFRGDSIIVAGTLRQTQIVSLLVLLAALWLMRQWATPIDRQEELV